MRIAILLMAAGESKRMSNRIKQLLPWKGSSLINHAIQTALNSEADNVRVVLGAYFEEIKRSLPDETEYYVCQGWKDGLGTSISCGVENLLSDTNKPDKILIMLVDQPLIDTKFINKLIHLSLESDKPIVATNYKGKAGVPAIFDKQLFPELSSLKGDVGARIIMENHIEEIEFLENTAAINDIDTWEDFIGWR